MLTLKELYGRASREHVPTAMVEKDIALTVTLQALAQAPWVTHVVFKGGTAIRKMYFPNARYSEDLDFTALDLTPEDVLSGVQQTLQGRTLDGIAFGTVENGRAAAGLKLAIKFTGPLQHPQRIWFDFSFRGDLKRQPIQLAILGEPMNPHGTVATMALPEILAEKTRAICSRQAARDLYDFWYLTHEQHVAMDSALIAHKFAIYGQTPTMAQFEQHARALQANWKTDLQPFLNPIPDFTTILEQASTIAAQTLPT